MSIIQKLQEQVLSTEHPLAKMLFDQPISKVLGIVFTKGMILKEHKTPYASKLIVLSGKVQYTEKERVVILHPFQEAEILASKVHQVEAIDDAVCLLIQGNK